MEDKEDHFSDQDIANLEEQGIIQNKHDILERSPKGRFLKFNDVIGTQAYKVIHRGYDNFNGCEIAWNSIKIAHLGKPDKAKVVEEVKLLESLNNPNIV
jgi:WNK lysine deficient protein kinase